MGYFYQALLDVYSEMEKEMAKEDKSDLVNFAKGEVSITYCIQILASYI